jgi:hypothetical protein
LNWNTAASAARRILAKSSGAGKGLTDVSASPAQGGPAKSAARLALTSCHVGNANQDVAARGHEGWGSDDAEREHRRCDKSLRTHSRRRLAGWSASTTEKCREKVEQFDRPEERGAWARARRGRAQRLCQPAEARRDKPSIPADRASDASKTNRPFASGGAKSEASAIASGMPPPRPRPVKTLAAASCIGD